MKSKRESEQIDYFLELFQYSLDINVKEHRLVNDTDSEQIIIVYCEALADTDLLTKSILPDLQRIYFLHGRRAIERKNEAESVQWNKKDSAVSEQIRKKVFDGFTAIAIGKTIYFFNTANPPKRTPEESITEVSLKGPRDGFIEDINSNIGLVRKRLKTNSLVTKSFTIGKRSNTKVNLVYLTDIQNDEKINEVTKRLNNVDIDILNSDNQLIELLGDSKYSLFPLMESISRPDGVVSCLMRGRFAIFIDNNPNVIIGPANLGLLLNSSEDAHISYYYVTLELFLRITGLILAIFLPAFWIALSAYNVDQIPFPLLATIGASRLGIPFNTTIEILLMLGLFELFREAGVRLPKAVGQTIAVVGGLIVGDAAIRAGMTSPTMLVISSITAVATFTLGNQSLFGTVTILRIFSILCASVLGMFGFFISLFFIVAYLAKLESFGIPYLSPISPFVKQDVLKSLFKLPVTKENKRAKMLKTRDKDRGDNN
ncbi:spore germination protein [Lentibacillus populi]|uniref:Spore germination protein n=1 Tax=Lentibacillus populi TaxID=1827502 RepID=A0A9W5TYG9_9BACI|nr:spore germination protein [Lentibacillus populi]GGB47535.1 spore germination protein [Lentibacillus populi]